MSSRENAANIPVYCILTAFLLLPPVGGVIRSLQVTSFLTLEKYRHRESRTCTVYEVLQIEIILPSLVNLSWIHPINIPTFSPCSRDALKIESGT